MLLRVAPGIGFAGLATGATGGLAAAPGVLFAGSACGLSITTTLLDE